MDIEVTDVTRRRNIPRENETRIKTSNILADFEEKTDLVSSVEALTGTGDENEGKVKSSDKYRKNEELDKIQKQIKELIKRKKEINKDEVMQKDKNIKEVQDEERLLPQRIPRVKPRVLSNVQLIPLRMEKHPVEDRSRTLDREIGKDSNIEGNENGRRT